MAGNGAAVPLCDAAVRVAEFRGEATRAIRSVVDGQI